MKKAFVWVMMGILAVSMLAGCGKKETEPVVEICRAGRFRRSGTSV